MSNVAINHCSHACTCIMIYVHSQVEDVVASVPIVHFYLVSSNLADCSCFRLPHPFPRLRHNLKSFDKTIASTPKISA